MGFFNLSYQATSQPSYAFGTDHNAPVISGASFSSNDMGVSCDESAGIPMPMSTKLNIKRNSGTILRKV